MLVVYIFSRRAIRQFEYILLNVHKQTSDEMRERERESKSEKNVQEINFRACIAGMWVSNKQAPALALWWCIRSTEKFICQPSIDLCADESMENKFS